MGTLAPVPTMDNKVERPPAFAQLYIVGPQLANTQRRMIMIGLNEYTTLSLQEVLYTTNAYLCLLASDSGTIVSKNSFNWHSNQHQEAKCATTSCRNQILWPLWCSMGQGTTCFIMTW